MTERVSFDAGVDLFAEGRRGELQRRAILIRQEKNPGQRITFVLDSNPNYTNVCDCYCTFCAFYRREGAPDAYTRSCEEVLEGIQRAKDAGITTILLQGGHNPQCGIDYYVSLVREAKARFPDMHLHFFSASEIQHCATVSKMSVEEVLQALYDAGQRSLPGAGAEVLSEPVRRRIAPKKIDSDRWIEIHKTAHRVGFRSTATMMYGHVETPHDVVTHLDRIRRAQDETGGFTAFIPWSYKKGNNPLGRLVSGTAGREEYLRMIAFSRIYLDNFDHIQASWFSEGKEVGIEALSYGADDFGGVLLEENVHKAADVVNKTNCEGIVAMIRQAGYVPEQRNPLYETVCTY